MSSNLRSKTLFLVYFNHAQLFGPMSFKITTRGHFSSITPHSYLDVILLKITLGGELNRFLLWWPNVEAGIFTLEQADFVSLVQRENSDSTLGPHRKNLTSQ